MGGSRSDSVDLEQGAVELDDEAAARRKKDLQFETGMCLAGFMLVLTVPTLVCYGPWAALAVAIAYAAEVVFVTWCVFRCCHLPAAWRRQPSAATTTSTGNREPLL